MSKVFLIGEQSLKDFNICDNLDANYLNPAISVSQEVYLHQLIGTRLLETIKGMVGDGSISDLDNQHYKILLDDYITPYLQHKVIAEITIPIAYKTRNAGVIQTNNEYVVNTQMKDAKYLENYYNDRADFYAIRMTKYIVANVSDYPEYNACGNCCGDINANDGINTNIYLD